MPGTVMNTVGRWTQLGPIPFYFVSGPLFVVPSARQSDAYKPPGQNTVEEKEKVEVASLLMPDWILVQQNFHSVLLLKVAVEPIYLQEDR